MKSKLNLTKVREDKILNVLRVLFPEYKYISINKLGIITFRKHWMSFGRKVSIFELAFIEISKRLSNYRKGTKDYNLVYEDCLRDIISNNQNIIDYICFEFNKIKTSSKTELLLENNPFEFQQWIPNNITIGQIVSNLRIRSLSFNNSLRSAVKYLKHINVENPRDKMDRLHFISIVQA